MAHIHTLITGTFTMNPGTPAPAGHADTWYKYAGDTEWRTVSISGSISGDVEEWNPTTQIPDVTDVVALEIGTDVTSIVDAAFYGCSELANVTIPNSVTNIGYDAFSDCYSLESVTIPYSVTSIGEDAFTSCNSLTSVTLQGKTFEQVLAMDNFPWGIDDASIINVA